MARKARINLAAGEFDNLYDFLKSEWDLETAKGVHPARGFHSNLALVLGINNTQIYGMVKRRKSNIRLTARQWTALANRYSVRVDTLLMLAYGHRQLQLKVA